MLHWMKCGTRSGKQRGEMQDGFDRLMKPHRDVHELPIAYLRSILSYDEENGLEWKVGRRGGVIPGSPAGFIDYWGAWRIRIDGKRYNGKRIAHAIVHGEWPPTANLGGRKGETVKSPWGEVTIPQAAKKLGIGKSTMYDRVRCWPRDKWFVPKDSEWRVQ